MTHAMQRAARRRRRGPPPSNPWMSIGWIVLFLIVCLGLVAFTMVALFILAVVAS